MEQDSGAFFMLSDLAAERGGAAPDAKGIEYTERSEGKIRREWLTVSDEEGEGAIGRPRGHYNTVSTGPFHTLTEGEIKEAKAAVAQELARICSPYPKNGKGLLVVGLGNREIAADSIGPRAVASIRQTATVKREAGALFRRLGCAEIRTLTPDVESKTGIGAAGLVRAALGEWGTSLVIAIDALATRSSERLCATLQLSDTGVFPGSGLGLCKEALNEDNLGVPVVAIGVPTVQSSHAYFLEEAERQGLAGAAVPKGAPVFFCPNTLEEDVAVAADILGAAINRAFGIEAPKE